MTTTPVWFGPAERPLFGWFHTPPSGQARGGVVICPPFIREHLKAHYTLRLLAESLQARGIAVLRFDYDGMGDSAGDIRDPNRLESWLRSIALGIELLRSAGVSEVSLVGMRIGATLSARAAAEHHGLVAQLVLWDPCPSGRSYLREQAAMTSLVLSQDPRSDDGGIDTPGLRFESQTVHELEELRLDRLAGPVARRVLVLTRVGHDPGGEAMARLGSAGVEHRVAVGQAELLDAEMHFEIPHATVLSISDWLEQAACKGAAAVRIPLRAGVAIVGAAPDGRSIVERPVRLPPVGLFGILTEVPGNVRSATVPVFINANYGHHVGPNRMWVDLARRLAIEGMQSVRVDLSGLGESPLRFPEQEGYVSRSPEAFVDVAEIAQAIAPGDSRKIVLVGHCASAYQAIDSALEIGAAGVVALNPLLTFVPPELERHQALDGRRRAALPRTPFIQAFHHNGRLSALRRRFPNFSWRMRLWAHPSRRPGSWLKTLIGRGTVVLVIAGDRELRPFKVGTSRRRRSRLERTGRFRMVHTADFQHSFILRSQRETTADLVATHLVDHFVSAPMQSVEADGAQALLSAGPGPVERPAWRVADATGIATSRSK